MTDRERTAAGWSRADQRALADGADIAQVTNAHRGVYTAGGRKFTTEGTTKRGLAGSRLGKRTARLTPEQIYLETGADRNAALRLLYDHGYLVNEPALVSRRSLALAADAPAPMPVTAVASFDRRLSRAATENAAWEATPRVLGDKYSPLARRSGVDDWSESDRRAAFEAVQGYKVNDYRGVNDRLRGRELRGMSAEEADRAIAAIDDAFRHSQLQQDVVVWRGVGTGRDVFGDAVDGDLTGVEWTDAAYMSTSALHDSAEHYARPRTRGGPPGVLFRIVVPPKVGAIGAEAVSDYRTLASASEAEVLLQRGLKLRVVRDRGLVAATDEAYAGPRSVRMLDVEVVPVPTKAAAVKKAAAMVGADLSKMTVTQLREVAKERGIKVPSRALKADIQALLRASKAPVVSDLSKLTIPKLRELAKERGVAIPSRALKADIVKLLEGTPAKKAAKKAATAVAKKAAAKIVDATRTDQELMQDWARANKTIVSVPGAGRGSMDPKHQTPIARLMYARDRERQVKTIATEWETVEGYLVDGSMTAARVAEQMDQQIALAEATLYAPEVGLPTGIEKLRAAVAAKDVKGMRAAVAKMKTEVAAEIKQAREDLVAGVSAKAPAKKAAKAAATKPEQLTIAELRALAKQHGVPLLSGQTKPDLIAHIRLWEAGRTPILPGTAELRAARVAARAAKEQALADDWKRWDTGRNVNIHPGHLPAFDPDNPLAAYGNRLTIEHRGDTAHKHLAELETIPLGAHARMQEHFAHLPKSGFYVGEAAVPELDELTRLRGVQPRGWDPGETWDIVPGAYGGAVRRCALGGGKGTMHGSTSLALHEAGHALDHAMEDFAGRASAGTPWHNVVDDVLATTSGSTVNPYFTPAGNPTGYRQEMWAESFAAWVVYRGKPDAAMLVGHKVVGRATAAEAKTAGRLLVAYFERLDRRGWPS